MIILATIYIEIIFTRRKFFLFCVKDSIEDVATFTALVKNYMYSTKFFCNIKVAGLGKIFIQRKFSCIQYFALNCLLNVL